MIEFALRRAQGVDGALAASRAALLGGCSGASDVLAGKLFGMPVIGTHAHSWVMTFPSEREAFDLYADALPNNCVFLVGTYDTLSRTTPRRFRRRDVVIPGVKVSDTRDQLGFEMMTH